MKINDQVALQKAFAEAKTEEDRIELFKANDSHTLRTLLAFLYNPKLKTILPFDEGIPSYKKYMSMEEPEWDLGRAMKSFQIFYNPNSNAFAVENIFFKMVENMNADEAELLCKILARKVSYGFKQKTLHKLLRNRVPEFNSQMPEDDEVKEIKIETPVIEEPMAIETPEEISEPETFVEEPAVEEKPKNEKKKGRKGRPKSRTRKEIKED